MTVGTNTIADIALPFTVPNGGFGVVTQSPTYGLLTGGTTSTGATQNAGTGTSGQLYMSGGASALGTWTSPNDACAMQLISTVTASSSASIAFTGLTTTYFAYKIIIAGLIPASASTLYAFTSSNNGVSYDSGASNYYSNALNAYASGLGVVGVTATQGELIVCATTVASGLEITLVNNAASLTDNFLIYIGRGRFSGSPAASVGMCCRLATQINNAIKFQMSTGNIASGVFKLYGILA